MTTTEMKNATLAELVTYYNELAASINEKVVKTFKDKETALNRIGTMRGLIKVQEASARRIAAAASKAAADKVKADAKAAKAKAKADAKKDDPTVGEPKTRGAKATFNYEPAAEQTAPRPGTLRGRAFELLQVGTTASDLEDLVVSFWKEKGHDLEEIKIGKRLRALELVRLLRYQNGYGFREEDGLIYVVGEVQGTGPKKVAKTAQPAKAEKAVKPAPAKTAPKSTVEASKAKASGKAAKAAPKAADDVL